MIYKYEALLILQSWLENDIKWGWEYQWPCMCYSFDLLLIAYGLTDRTAFPPVETQSASRYMKYLPPCAKLGPVPAVEV